MTGCATARPAPTLAVETAAERTSAAKAEGSQGFSSIVSRAAGAPSTIGLAETSGGTGRARKVDDDPGFAGGKQAETKALHERGVARRAERGRPTDRAENSPPAGRQQCDRARPRRRRWRRPGAKGRTPVWPRSRPVRAARRPRPAGPHPSRTRAATAPPSTSERQEPPAVPFAPFRFPSVPRAIAL